jgi:hypothetical protein
VRGPRFIPELIPQVSARSANARNGSKADTRIESALGRKLTLHGSLRRGRPRISWLHFPGDGRQMTHAFGSVVPLATARPAAVRALGNSRRIRDARLGHIGGNKPIRKIREQSWRLVRHEAAILCRSMYRACSTEPTVIGGKPRETRKNRGSRSNCRGACSET